MFVDFGIISEDFLCDPTKSGTIRKVSHLP